MQRITKSSIESALTSELHLKDAHFVLEKDGTRIDGSIISPSFKRKRHLTRQLMIVNALEKIFGVNAHKVGMLLAYTPDEWDPFGTDSPNGHSKRSNGHSKVKSGK